MKKFIFAFFVSILISPCVVKAMKVESELSKFSTRVVKKEDDDGQEISESTPKQEIEEVDVVEEGRFLKLPDDHLVQIISFLDWISVLRLSGINPLAKAKISKIYTKFTNQNRPYDLRGTQLTPEDWDVLALGVFPHLWLGDGNFFRDKRLSDVTAEGLKALSHSPTLRALKLYFRTKTRRF